ncbi:cytochrome c oxidase subunit 3 [Streptomyces fuscichromogenes]|uniref:Cytochrome aa3 subunit 3 n=1 Tax=Streptomyces fuscichromogenes TaxID=1324013 RepID=A0A917XGH6_9ACTN|nr:cytochrome c oxidase subunit 3 [Streptomyces fuscichromogenes]GGN19720.1 cytochrome c oxidase subunit III [Streptomyces fuscichromogenes]
MTTSSVKEAEAGKAVPFVPGQPDMWFFALFETLVFTAYFVVYMFARMQHHEAFLQSQAKLSLSIGTFNTLVLLVSSWSMARCVKEARVGAYRSALTNAFLTASFGVVFLGSKIYEWVREIRLGYGFASDEFFSYYFFLTGIHALHLLIGFVVLGVVVHQLRSPERRSQNLVETGAVYWHTVDFLWVLVFSLLYVVR